MKEDIKDMLEKNIHSIIVHATAGIDDVDLTVIGEITKRAIKLFEMIPNGHWRKVDDEWPYLCVPVLLKFPGGAVRIGQLADTSGRFVSYGYKQDWKLTPIEWQFVPE